MNVRNSNHTHHLSVYAYLSDIHYKCGGYCLFTFGFTRASNEIDDVTPHLNQYNNFKFLNYSIFNLNQ